LTGTILVERLAIPVKSFRLTQRYVKAYDSVLAKLRIDGANESEKFRNLLDFLDDYFESEPRILPEQVIVEEPSQFPRLEVFDLILTALKEHEKSLSGIVERFEKPPAEQVFYAKK
jgi:hypothetical protein